MSDDSNPLASFAGVARLFPLPNLVFFPHVLQPLYIFEPRYRQMTADALSGDGLIALTMLQDSGDAHPEDRPAIHKIATLGKIVASQRYEDGRYNIILRGLSRLRIIREIAKSKLYREAEVELLPERRPEDPGIEADMIKQLAEQMPLWFPKRDEVANNLRPCARRV